MRGAGAQLRRRAARIAGLRPVDRMKSPPQAESLPHSGACAWLDLREALGAISDGVHRDLIALEQGKQQVGVTRILGIFQVLAALDLSVRVSEDRGGQRIVVVAVAVAHIAAKENRGMI